MHVHVQLATCKSTSKNLLAFVSQSLRERKERCERASVCIQPLWRIYLARARVNFLELKPDVYKTFLNTSYAILHVYLRPPGHLIPPGPSVPSTLWSFAAALLADKRDVPFEFLLRQMYRPGGQQIFKAGNYPTNLPRPASVSTSRIPSPLEP